MSEKYISPLDLSDIRQPRIVALDAREVYRQSNALDTYAIVYEDLRSSILELLIKKSEVTEIDHSDPTSRDYRSSSKLRTVSGLLLPGMLSDEARYGLEIMYREVCSRIQQHVGYSVCKPWTKRSSRQYEAAAVAHMYDTHDRERYEMGEFHIDQQPSATWHLGTVDGGPYYGRGLVVSHHPGVRDQNEVYKREHSYHAVEPDTIVIVDDSTLVGHGVAPHSGSPVGSVNFSASNGVDVGGIADRWDRAR